MPTLNLPHKLISSTILKRNNMKWAFLITLLAAFVTSVMADDVDKWIHDLNDTSLSVRESAVKALGQLYDDRAVVPLIRSLKDDDSQIRKEAAYALRQLEDSRAVVPLIGSLKDEDSQVRKEAAKALGQLNDSRAFGPLIESLKDEGPQVREEAAKALRQLNDSWVEPVEPSSSGLSRFIVPIVPIRLPR